MKRNLGRLARNLPVIIVAAVLTAIAACSAPPAASPAAAPAQPSVPTVQTGAPEVSYTINIANKAGIGNYLVDSNGLTLYYFLKDTADQSNANSAIIALWPVFYTGNVVVPPQLNAADFGAIQRNDGTWQSTYQHWPLYYFAQDQSAGDTKGHGFNNLWFAVTPGNMMSAPAAPLTPAPPATNSAPVTPPPNY